jgi:hypothetical protein
VIRVKAGVFSMTPPAPPDDDGSYLKWHLLDHMPEQYQLPGIVHAQRWIADGEYLASRLVSDGPLGDVGNVMNYLMGDPVQRTLDDFIELGGRLREIGRYAIARPTVQVAALALLRWYASPAALISPEVVPFRPHRGVVLIVEEPTGERPDDWLQWLHHEHHPHLLELPGTAGVWMYGTTGSWEITSPIWRTAAQYITVVYLDEEPLATTKSLAPVIEQRWASGAVRPVFAGPLRTMVQWEAWT